MTENRFNKRNGAAGRRQPHNAIAATSRRALCARTPTTLDSIPRCEPPLKPPTVRAAFATRRAVGFARNTASTFDVFYRLQVTNFDVPLLQSAPNRPDYIDTLALWLHGQLFLGAFALGWGIDRLGATIFLALPRFEVALMLARLDHSVVNANDRLSVLAADLSPVAVAPPGDYACRRQ